ncbi:glycoside hydrolase family 16 protein [Aquisalinus flavus]|uniref:GH16 domain-containing protein n=1 Tax=Aquisalinus flavus TaxID=1526572 RepID=A0A8J2V750_9PROT|nr:glycoside hydrolase family 16 protein [Aquisalinus flavus]MBD0427466.1 glycoside hydrolase family 16 protein [Aquisalinus flavus]UNE47265.1 glycoside hydrolase family 16 protein [Aquisalinus flavus]GGD01222.1 hypothetical protein GCM10011342_07790 [Aquisalinus flavus]
MASTLHGSHFLKASLLALATGLAAAACASADDEVNLGAKEAAGETYMLEQTPPAGYELVWADEFNGEGLPDASKWAYDTHANKGGWYNDELQYYADARLQNSRQEDGVLVIEAHREELAQEDDWGGQEFTSARLITEGRQSWQYGFFEIRAKVPCGYGVWPAIWMLSDSDLGWPDGGEIDIMEHVGTEPDTVYGTVHTRDYTHSKGTGRGSKIDLPTACEAFHDYQLHWTKDRIEIGVDGEIFFALDNDGTGTGSWPFFDPQYLLMNVAVGGWGGNDESKIAETEFPVRMEVDYVRVWQEAE